MSKCPICGKKPVFNFRPFCSDGCRSVDLHRWLTEQYRVPGEPITAVPAEDLEEDE